MINRSPNTPRPIAFADPLHEPVGPASRAVRWTPLPPSPPSTAHMPISQGRASLMPMRAMARAQPATEASQPRQAQARYDGPNSLSVRSSATGRHYRFTHPGAVEVIDAADMALMRRIEAITLL